MFLSVQFVGAGRCFTTLKVYASTIYEAGKDRFGLIEPKKASPTHTPSRRQNEISSSRREVRSLRQRWIRANEEEKPWLSDIRNNYVQS